MALTWISRAPDHPDLSHLHSREYPVPGARSALLVLHGFTGTAGEMAIIGERAAAAGIASLIPGLPGHGSVPGDMSGIRYVDWLNAATAAYDQLRRQYSQVFVAGLSMGAVLAQTLLQHPQPPDRTVLLATPDRIVGPRQRRQLAVFRRLWIRRRIAWIKDGGSDISIEAERARPINYRWAPLEAVCEVNAMFERVRRRRREAAMPTLMIHGAGDHSAPLAGARVVARDLGPGARLAVARNSWHVLTRDVDADATADLATNFLAGTELDSLSLPDGFYWDGERGS